MHMFSPSYEYFFFLQVLYNWDRRNESKLEMNLGTNKYTDLLLVVYLLITDEDPFKFNDNVQLTSLKNLFYDATILKVLST